MSRYVHWSSGSTRYTIGEIIERDVKMEGYDERDAVRSVQKELDRLLQVVKVLADVGLTDEQEAKVARAMRYMQASSEIGRPK